jgi:hypothetical protein
MSTQDYAKRLIEKWASGCNIPDAPIHFNKAEQTAITLATYFDKDALSKLKSEDKIDADIRLSMPRLR